MLGDSTDVKRAESRWGDAGRLELVVNELKVGELIPNLSEVGELKVVDSALHSEKRLVLRVGVSGRGSLP